MTNKSYTQFTMTYKGDDYIVEADISFTQQISHDKHRSASDWDLESELYLESILIVDKDGKDVTECLDISNSDLIKKMIQNKELDEDEYEGANTLYSRGLEHSDFGEDGFMRDKHFSEDGIIE